MRTSTLRLVSETKFGGDPCRTCGSTTRYISSRSCVACTCAAARRQRWRREDPAYREALRAADRRRYAAHPEVKRDAARAWRQANPEKTLEKKRARRALENGAASDGTHRLWDERLREHDGTCVHCGELRPLGLDHFIPLAKGGAHVLLNFVPSCRSCNSAKHATVIAMTARIRSFIDGSLAAYGRSLE
jgi:5-methylcytosine-specific restriction endonuclease McrA